MPQSTASRFTAWMKAGSGMPISFYPGIRTRDALLFWDGRKDGFIQHFAEARAYQTPFYIVQANLDRNKKGNPYGLRDVDKRLLLATQEWLRQKFSSPEEAYAIAKVERIVETAAIRGGRSCLIDAWYINALLGNAAFQESDSHLKDLYFICMKELEKAYPKGESHRGEK